MLPSTLNNKMTKRGRMIMRMSTSKKANQLPKYFSTSELNLILSNYLKEEDYVTWFLCYMLSRTGARISELLEVKLSDIDFVHKTIRLITLKRANHQRIVPLQAEVLGIVGEWIARNQLTRDDKLFKFGRKMADIRVKKACKLAGTLGDRDHAHSFRHTFAVICISNNVPVPVLSEWLGHANIANTLIYTRLLARDSYQYINNINWN